MQNYFSAIAIAVIVFLAGCVILIPPSPNQNPLQRLTAIDRGAVFAASPSGTRVALVKDGLKFFDLATGDIQSMAKDNALALAWSRDGSTLAAAFPVVDDQTRLLLFSAQGEVQRELLLPMQLTGLTWSTRGDLLVTGLALKVYAFGVNLRQFLFRITSIDLEETILSDSTLGLRLVSRLTPLLLQLQTVVFSPNGDELVFLDLRDPPEFSPFLQLTYRNWQVGKDRPLLRLPLQPVHLNWNSSDDALSILSGEHVRSLALWTYPGETERQPALDEVHFFSGRLYRGQKMLVNWGVDAKLQRLADGRFLLATQKTLYLGNGLPDEPLPDFNEKDWNLRRWRYQGLITPGEYQKLLEENHK